MHVRGSECIDIRTRAAVAGAAVACQEAAPGQIYLSCYLPTYLPTYLCTRAGLSIDVRARAAVAGAAVECEEAAPGHGARGHGVRDPWLAAWTLLPLCLPEFSGYPSCVVCGCVRACPPVLAV